MAGITPWRQRLAAGTEETQAEIVTLYRDVRHSKAYLPSIIWGTIQTEAYATAVLRRVVDFHEVPDDVPAGVAQRMARQRVLYDGEHSYEVVLGEQALYTNIGGPSVMRGQLERLLGEFGLASLELAILPRAAEMSVLPEPGFNVYDDSRVTYELVSSGVDITDPAEVALHLKAFEGFSQAAAHGAGAKALIAEALGYWAGEG